MSRKGFGVIALILVIAGILLLGGGTWYYLHRSGISQKTGAVPDFATSTASTTLPTVPPASWNTYHSDRYGFTIRYPSDWSVQVHSNAEVLIVNKALEANGSEEVPDISIEAMPEDKDQSIENIDSFGYIDFSKECKTIPFAGAQAYDCNPAVSFAGDRIVILAHASIPFVIDDTVQNATSSQIVSSFGFTDSSSTPPVSSLPSNGIYDPAKWILVNSKQFQIGTESYKTYLLRSIELKGQGGVGEPLYGISMRIAQGSHIIYNYTPTYPSSTINADNFYMNDNTLVARDVTNDGTSEVIFNDGFAAADGDAENVHVVYGKPSGETGAPASFVDVRQNDFTFCTHDCDFEWFNEGTTTMALVAESIAPADFNNPDSCTQCAKPYEYTVYQWKAGSGGDIGYFFPVQAFTSVNKYGTNQGDPLPEGLGDALGSKQTLANQNIYTSPNGFSVVVPPGYAPTSTDKTFLRASDGSGILLQIESQQILQRSVPTLEDYLHAEGIQPQDIFYVTVGGRDFLKYMEDDGGGQSITGYITQFAPDKVLDISTGQPSVAATPAFQEVLASVQF